MKNKDEQKQRLSVTLLFSGVVILNLIIILLLVGLGIYILVQAGILAGPGSGEIPVIELLVIFVCSSIIAGSGMTLLLSRIPLKPVNTLLNIMNRLASGDFSARITLPALWQKHPGVVELSDSFNKMADELEHTEMLRSDFVNNFSHEFKTPIVSIAGFAKLLKREQLTDKQAEYVRIIEEESLRLSAMATNVLDLTKVENQTILTDVTTYNLSEQLRSCILLLSNKWENKGIEFSLVFDEYDITGNQDLLKHVWLNLIDNAIKFSPENETIVIAIEGHYDFIEVTVTNKGTVIPPESQQKIFNKFYQADESHSTEGNGVGLAVVKRVVELHNGSVTVQSSNGATMFSVQLPIV